MSAQQKAALELVTECAAKGSELGVIDAMILCAKLGVSNADAMAAFRLGKTRNTLGL